MKDKDYIKRMPEDKIEKILLYNEQDVVNLFHIYMNWNKYIDYEEEVSEIKSIEDIHDNTMDTELDSLTLIVSSNEEEAVKVLKGIDLVKSASVIDEEIHLIIESGKTSELLGILLNKKIKVEEIFKNRKGLEQRYMELVEGGIR